MFDENFIKSLPDEPNIALKQICKSFFDNIPKKDADSYTYYLSSYAFLEEFIKSYNLNIKLDKILFRSSKHTIILKIENRFKEIMQATEIDVSASSYEQIRHL